MGNNSSLLEQWEVLVASQASKFIRCRDSALINAETETEYTLRFRQHEGNYSAANKDQNYLVSIIRCPNFRAMKALSITTRILAKTKHTLIAQVLDSFSYKEFGSSVMQLVVVTSNSLEVSVGDLVETTQIRFQLEDVMQGLFKGLEYLRSIHGLERQLGFISAKNLMLYKDLKKLKFYLKLAYGFPCSSERPPELDYENPLGDVWAIGCLLFVLLTGIPPRVSKLGLKPEAERLVYIRQHVIDVALSELISMCCCNKETRKTCEEILAHPYVQWWMFGSVPMNFGLIQALHTQLKFASKHAKVTAVKGLFSLTTLNPSRVFSFVQLHSIDWALIVSIFIETLLNSTQLEGAILLFNAAMKHSKGARRLFLKTGLIEIVLKHGPSLGFKLMIEFFGDFCMKSTCTVPVLLYDKQLHLKALTNYNTCTLSQNFLYNSAPFFGKYAVDLIILAYQRRAWTCHQAIEILLKVPFHNLMLHKQVILKHIETCIGLLVSTQFSFSSSLQNALKLLSTITIIREVFEHTSQRGSCLSSPEFAFASDLVRCPLVIFCSDCAVPVCVFCGATCHRNCKLRPLYPQSTFKACRCGESHEEIKQRYPVFNIKKRGLYVFKAVNQANIEIIDLETYLISCSRYNGDPVEVISLETLVPPDKWERSSNTAFYFEAKIISAGIRDALSIGVEGLEYQSWNGQIVDSEMRLVLRAVPYGSHDSIGVGITHDRMAYFTLNGLMLHPLIPLPSCKLKIKFFTEDASVLLFFNISRCMFQPKSALQLQDIRLRACQSIPCSLQEKLEQLLLDNFAYFEVEDRLENLLMFLSNQFSGQVGRSVLHRAMRSTGMGRRNGEATGCTLQ